MGKKLPKLFILIETGQDGNNFITDAVYLVTETTCYLLFECPVMYEAYLETKLGEFKKLPIIRQYRQE